MVNVEILIEGVKVDVVVEEAVVDEVVDVDEVTVEVLVVVSLR